MKSSLKILSGIKKQLRCKIRIHPLRLSIWRTQTSKNAGYIKMTVGNDPKNQGSRDLEQLQSSLCKSVKETRRSSRTSKTKGYAENVQSTQANAAFFTEMQQDHTLAQANLATVTQANITLIALLANTIADISNQVYTLTVKLATL